MIRIKHDNQNVKKEIFEFLRIKFPSYERNNLMDVDIKVSDNYKINIKFKEFSKFIVVRKVNDLKLQKILIKQELYKALSPYFENKDEWGILTGVRPIKLILQLLEDNDEFKTKLILREKYLLNDDLIKYLLDIAKRESKIIYPIDRDSYSIYIHIPFCPSKCSYCSFQTLIYNSEISKIYVTELIEELKRESIFFTKPPKTVYIGGGTPTSIGVKLLRNIIDTVGSYYGVSEEFTVECGRPDTINEEMLLMLKEMGINRISINPQSMNECTLKNMGRNHSMEDIYRAYELSRKIGFFCINMDLILGLPGESLEDNRTSLNKIIKLGPENITVHTLSVKNGSKLFDEKYMNNVSINRAIEYTKNITLNSGYFPYYLYRQKRMLGSGENIGYCKEGFESMYNILMMEEKQSIIGFGMSSSSKFFYPELKKVESVMNFRNMKDYVERNSEIYSKKIKQYKNFNF
ncbi:oxygen-independent coproporphyrinogen-3 oxidase [Anaerosphaera aminiphila DSM 21120]|uniref:Oxygen-independent coproporphyrinogen-3 oxidase n=2 Tax=Anaerosphaera TaxID=1273095 RepID=A0A1M5UUV4_9FIRM|nr:oxygen-independent coproporphyrinogen-3 oxidase [Anaerosphaera aminiphila DSM 21120]